MNNKDNLFKKIALKFVTFLLRKLNYLYNFLTYNENEKLNYEYLVPNDEAEHILEYSKALEEALRNKKVRNIAISGSYGSGKSSFLKTFEKKYKNSTYRFLDISLARFSIETENKAENKVNLSLIEKSILEQMFYRVKIDKIPQSRLSKISRIKSLNLKTILIILFLFTCFIIFKPKFLSNITLFRNLLITPQIKYFEYGSIVIFLIIFYFCTRKLFYILSNINISKLSLKNLELTSNDRDNESLLNKHLDEILYFFEQTAFNVVVFQDLDRFENLEIFTKLRELNNFINNSEQMSREVKFIYAVRDSIFLDAYERTKFFDFVIPIIPYINASSSEEKLLELFKDEINTSFLYSVSLYITDMRLLKNIYNEYKIYGTSLDEQLNKTNLLAMIVYKNFYPKDFEKLHKNYGIVYEVFSKKSEYTKNMIDKLNSNIKYIENKIKEIDDEPLKSIIELRMVYLLKIIEKLGDQYRGNIYLEDRQLNIASALEDENFELISNSSQKHTIKKTDFKSIEKEVHPKYSYKQREQFIKNKRNNEKNKLLKQIKELRSAIDEIENYSIQKIIKTYEDINVLDEEFEGKDLLKYLICNGHINEDYNLYISNFFGTSIAKTDYDFLLNIKNNGKHLDFNYELSNLEELLREERLGAEEYKKESILNFNLVDYIITNIGNYKRQYLQLFNQLATNKEATNKFIFEYLDRQKNLKEFINGIARYHSAIWQYIASNKTDEEKDKYFYMFLEYLETDRLKNLNIDNSLVDYIALLQKIASTSEEINNKLKILIGDLNIKFKLFKNYKKQANLFKFIYKNNYYELNKEMIDYIVFIKSNENSDIYDSLNKAHYTTVLESNAEKLKLYIDENLDRYINSVSLTMDTNIHESENTILTLLNSDNEKLKEETKIRIIEHQETKVSDISLVGDRGLWNYLLKENKLTSSWENAGMYYDYVETLDEVLIGYLNNIDNSELLLDIRIDEEYIEQYPDFNTKLLRDLIECNDFELKPYSNLVRKNGYFYEDLDLSRIDEEKINILLDDEILKFGNINFELLKENSASQHILFLEKNIDEFIDNFDSFNIESDDIAKLLETKIAPTRKKELIDLIDYSLIDTPVLAKLIYANTDKSEIKPYEYVEKMISNLESIESKVALLIEQQSGLNNNSLVSLLSLMPDEYRKVANLDGKQTLLPDQDYNRELSDILEAKGLITSWKSDKKHQIRLFIKDKK